MPRGIRRRIELHRQKRQAKEAKKAKIALFVRPIARKYVEPLLRRCIAKIKSANVSEEVKQNALKQIGSYHAFYANERGDVLGVHKQETENLRFWKTNITEIFVDVLKPNGFPEFYGEAHVEATEHGVEMTSAERAGKDAGGSKARGLIRIMLDEALKMRKKGQPITIVTEGEEEQGVNMGLVKYYEQFGFDFTIRDEKHGLVICNYGVLSAEKIEHKQA